MSVAKSDFDSMLKIDYKGPMADMLENSTYFLSRIERYREPTGGKYMYIALRTGRTTSIGARGDASTEVLPVGDRPTWGSATFVAKPLYATVRLSGFSMRSSNMSGLAFEKALTSTMELTVNDMKKDLNRQLFGTGDAQLAQVNSTLTTTSVTLANKLYPTDPAKFLYVREKIDVRVITTGTVVSGADSISVVSITKTTPTAPVVVVDGAGFTQTATTQAVYREDNAATGDCKEIYGLCAALYDVNPSATTIPVGATNRGASSGNTNFGSIDRSTAGNEFWKGNVLSNSGTLRPFSVQLMMQAVDTAEIVGSGKITVFQTNHAIYRVYGGILAASKQFDGATMKLDGGWDALSVGGIPMVKDVECPDYHVFAIDETTLMLGVCGDWAWLGEEGGSGVINRLDGYDQYEAVFNRDCQLICDRPNANCVVADIAHS